MNSVTRSFVVGEPPPAAEYFRLDRQDAVRRLIAEHGAHVVAVMVRQIALIEFGESV